MTRNAPRSCHPLTLPALLVAALTLLSAVLARADLPEHSLILISIDGARHDYLALHPSPNLNRIANEGLWAEGLRPVFPTKTFPNHYSLVTGLYPAQHGIVDNSMYDPLSGAQFSLGNRAAVQSSEWWQGEPIWVTAERQGLPSATFFFPGSEAAIAGYRPSPWFVYDESIPNSERVDTVLEWLSLPAAEQPRLITLYFSDVDTQGHRHGPYSDEVAEAMRSIDAEIGRLFTELQSRGWREQVDVMIFSDHGMTEVDLRRHTIIDEAFDSALAERVIYSRELTSIFPLPGKEAQIRAQLERTLGAGASLISNENTPAEWGPKVHHRIAPIRVLADVDHVLLRRQWLRNFQAEDSLDRPRGGHGYDNREPDMMGLFIAHGPSFPQGTRTSVLETVDLYNVMARVLGLEPAPNAGDTSKIHYLLRAE